MSFAEKEKILEDIYMKKFTVTNITTWGLEQDRKYGGYKLPVSFKYEPDLVDKIEEIVEDNDAKDIFYGESKTMYFRVFELTRKQRDD